MPPIVRSRRRDQRGENLVDPRLRLSHEIGDECRLHDFRCRRDELKVLHARGPPYKRIVALGFHTVHDFSILAVFLTPAIVVGIAVKRARFHTGRVKSERYLRINRDAVKRVTSELSEQSFSRSHLRLT